MNELCPVLSRAAVKYEDMIILKHQRVCAATMYGYIVR